MNPATAIALFAIWLGFCHGRVLPNITRNAEAKPYNQTHQQTVEAGKYTYWIDQSCLDIESDYTDSFFDDSLDSMFDMACGASASLKPDPVVDDDFARVFNMLFSTDVGDTQVYQQSPMWRTRFGTRIDPGLKTPKAMVYDTLNSICKDWYETSNRASSNLRIFCDDGDVYTGGNDRGPWNPVDGIMANARCGPTADDTVAFVGWHAAIGKDWDSQNINRVAMTLCDGAFQGGRTFQSIDPKADLQMSGGKRAAAESYRRLMPVTMLHEWTHAWPYLLYDAAGKDSYGWEASRVMEPAKSLINADSFAFTGLMALLARQRRPDLQTGDVSDPSTFSGGYTIKRMNPDAGLLEKLHTIESNEEGELYFYPDISTPGNPHGKNP